jgi:hypothetical protein
MKFNKVIIACCAFLFGANTLPAQPNGQALVYKGAVIHVGNGKIIPNGMVICQGGKIVYVGENTARAGKNGIVKDVTGKHLYPGLIALNNIAGLNEIDAAKPTHDYAEVGNLNPNIRSAPAYNCDSKILPTMLYNGILFTQPTPQGGSISGTSSIMATACNNWPAAAVKTDAAMHIRWPEFTPHARMSNDKIREAKEHTQQSIVALKSFFTEAAAYHKMNNPQPQQLKFEACKKLFNGNQKLFLHVTQPDVLVDAALFFKSLNIAVVWASANRAAEIIPFLQEQKLSVVVNSVHRLPAVSQSSVNEPYALPAVLAKNNILFAITYSGSWEVRSLPYSVGTAITYGLDKEVALSCVTMQAANLAGVGDVLGTIEEGKSASLIICGGDIFDMQSGKIEEVLLNGINVNLNENKQIQLYKKYNEAK